MNSDLHKVKIVSVSLVVLVAMLMISCPGGDGGKDTKGDDSNGSIFTDFEHEGVNTVYAVAIDASGGKWFGTDEGVSYLDDNGTPTNKADDIWTTFTTTDGLSNNLVLAVGIEASGRKWFETYGGGVSCLDDNGTPTNKTDDVWTTFTTTDGLINNYVRVVAIDASGGKWFGATGDGVSYLDDNGTPSNKADDTWTSFTVADGLADQYVDAIAIDASGGKWFGTLDWVNYFDDNGTPSNKADDTWITFDTSDGLASAGIPDIQIDQSGGKWFGQAGGGAVGGVSYLDDNGTPTDKADDNWMTFTPADGLASNVVAAVAIDSSGGKWFGHEGDGLSYLNDNGTPIEKSDDIWTTYKYIDGLIYGAGAIAIDVSDGKWIGGGGGVHYLP